MKTFQLFVHNLTGYLISSFFTLILLLQWAFRLLTIIGIGYKWITAVCRLGLFAMVLLPAWWRPLFPYLFSHKIIRSIPYGQNLRNVVDIYLPTPLVSTSPAPIAAPGSSYPVAVLVWGGAWTIGYKVWPFILAQKLASLGIICVVIDYRNFPQGNIINMVEDLNNAMNWTFNNIESYGGDPDRITLIGQSAGAHLAVLSLLQQAKGGENLAWDYSRLRHFVGMSGAYDLMALKPILDKHGLAEPLFRAIMDQDINSNSPIFYLKSNFGSQENGYIALNLPPITLVHGTKDKTISSDFTLAFAEELKRLNINVQTNIFEGKSHTDFFLEDMIEGNGEPFIDFLSSIILKKDTCPSSDPQNRIRPFTHPFLVKLARIVNPF